MQTHRRPIVKLIAATLALAATSFQAHAQYQSGATPFSPQLAGCTLINPLGQYSTDGCTSEKTSTQTAGTQWVAYLRQDGSVANSAEWLDPALVSRAPVERDLWEYRISFSNPFPQPPVCTASIAISSPSLPPPTPPTIFIEHTSTTGISVIAPAQGPVVASPIFLQCSIGQ